MAELDRVQIWAEALIARHLDPEWTFGFDRAKTRAGLCNHTRKHISVSCYLAAHYGEHEIQQVLLHEIAHALAGARCGHGAPWLAAARRIGYEGGRLHHGGIADELAPWIGFCPRGHTHFRFRIPHGALACRLCAQRFDPANLITWRRRVTRV
jgi:hypothetical protein